MTHNSYFKQRGSTLSARTLISSNNIVQIWEYVSHSSVQVGDAPIFFFYFLFFQNSRIALKCCLSLCPLLTHYCWCDWDKKGESGRGGEGWKGHAWVAKNTNDKHHFEISVLLRSTSFLPRRARGKKPNKKKDPAGAPFHLLLLRLLQFVADSHEKRLCGRRERGAKWKWCRWSWHQKQEISCCSPAKRAFLFVCLFWSTSSFICLNAHRSFSPPFPCSRTFHNMLVVSASRRSFFSVLFPSVLVVKSCTCLFQIQYPVS